MLTPAQISARISEYFRSDGFDLTTPMNVVNLRGRTDLVIAGVQMFDDIIHLNQKMRKEKLFVAQPCVRMQFQPHVEAQEGTSTSFVNVCTEKMGAEFSEHLQLVDNWCTILSKLGLHMKDFVIIMRTSDHDWGTGKFSTLELFFSYGGLEIGDAAYLLIPQANRPTIPISDIGFGLERIAWAVNKTTSYFDTLIPWTAGGTREMFDSCRTVALLLLCGVQAANRGPGLQFRRFAKVLSEKYYGADVYNNIAYYFDYWAQFIKPLTSRDVVVQLARLEIERFINLKVCDILKLPPPRDETTEAYLDRLVYTFNINIYELRKAIKTCKT
ncbi:hypothetical protein HYW32_01235 [Candidatus Berkelbacteria bacterium]|nr:hypothetical protein [Candidatus Berkelbacteria bacterium]